MKQLSTIVLSLLSVLLFTNCASTYKPINPSTLAYSATTLVDGVTFSYRYNVLNDARNNKYAKREYVKNFRLVAVKFTNNTGQTINVSEDLQFFAGNKPIFPVEPNIIKYELKQSTAPYLLYLLLTPINLTVYRNDPNSYPPQENKIYPIGLFLGPGISLGNMMVASSANNMFYNELLSNNINNATLKDGETITGLMGFRDIGFDPLSISLKQK